MLRYSAAFPVHAFQIRFFIAGKNVLIYLVKNIDNYVNVMISYEPF